MKIISNLSLGGNYRKIILTHSLQSIDSSPGTCCIINDRWLAVAEITSQTLSFVTKGDSFLVREPVSTFEFPAGKGFSSHTPQHALVIAAGTGIGAISRIVHDRTLKSLSTKVLILGREFSQELVWENFPQFRSATIWDTVKLGRPEHILSNFYDSTHSTEIYVAGPKSLVESIRFDAQSYSAICHTNF